MKDIDTLIKPEIQALIDRYKVYYVRVSKKEWDELILNSYERNLLYPILDNECLLYVCSQMLQHLTTETRYPSTYDDIVKAILFPLVLQRLSNESKATEKLTKHIQQQTRIH